MGLWSYSGETTPTALGGATSKAEWRRNVCLAFERGRAANDLGQATNFIQINSRMIAPMSDMIKPAG